MARQINIAEAKAKLSELVEAASKGEEIVLARHGKPMARLSRLTAPAKREPRKFGQLEHLGRNIDWDQWWKDWKAADAEIEADFERSRLFPPGSGPLGPGTDRKSKAKQAKAAGRRVSRRS